MTALATELTSTELAPLTHNGKTAEQYRAMAHKCRQRAVASFERCDTDGALSQWGSELSAAQYDLQAALLDNGGRADFPALYTLNGALVPAVYIQARYGYAWALLESDDPRSRYIGWFNPSKAMDGHRARGTDAARGYYVGYAAAPAVADIKGESITSCAAKALRTDGGFSRDMIPVDDGQQPELGRWYQR